MATRPDCDLKNAVIQTREVETSTTVTVGQIVKDGNADHECQPCTDGVQAIGVVTELGSNSGAAGKRVSVCLLAGGCIVPVKVGTGGATRGKFAKVVSDGVTDAAESVTTPAGVNIVGFFTQSGSAGDLVGMVPIPGWITE